MAMTVGTALVAALVERGIEVVFGIPGVHTVELYRGLGGGALRHVTPRHEQGAGFMADGYARACGKPAAVFVITGPGLTNTLTPMAQALAESVPMVVVTGVNRRDSLGRGLGFLHELPDQQTLASQAALLSATVMAPEDLAPALDAAWTALEGRPGPVHIEVPTDVMPLGAAMPATPAALEEHAAPPDLTEAIAVMEQAGRTVVLVGGGARWCAQDVRKLAEHLDAPVVQTVNARGIMFDHPLGVPASPSLRAVRDLLEGADVVLALGTELGQTDYDTYALGEMPQIERLVRVDICPDQLDRYPAAVKVASAVEAALPILLEEVTAREPGNGHRAAAKTRAEARAELDSIAPDYGALVGYLETLRDAFPGALIVGDSTQMIYAGNLFYDHDRPGAWFNGSTGFGALGYAIPAAIGAAIAEPNSPVIALMGDGGAQFTLPELGVAVDEGLPILFVIWNNRAYGEIAQSMIAVDVEPIGCHPTPPDFSAIATAYGVAYHACRPEGLADALAALGPLTAPIMLEIEAD